MKVLIAKNPHPRATISGKIRPMHIRTSEKHPPLHKQYGKQTQDQIAAFVWRQPLDTATCRETRLYQEK